jgi:hypothetical protein
MHRAPSHNMYINQRDAQNSCDWTLFSIRCCTCFGLYQSIIRSNFISCTSHLVYAGICRYHTCGCCVAIAGIRSDTHRTVQPTIESCCKKFSLLSLRWKTVQKVGLFHVPLIILLLYRSLTLKWCTASVSCKNVKL